MSTVITKFPLPGEISEREALRYAGCRSADDSTVKLLRECVAELRDKLSYKVCYCELPLETDGDICRFGSFSVSSRALAKCLRDCRKVLLFGATVGVGPDRLISRYIRTSPSKAVILQAVGAERIEALCDTFCREYEMENGVSLTPRFSPGYGDLPLGVQRDMFAVLDCPRRIGLSLNESLLMSPSKSVTAFAGIRSEAQ